jgi:hypothetical protein
MTREEKIKFVKGLKVGDKFFVTDVLNKNCSEEMSDFCGKELTVKNVHRDSKNVWFNAFEVDFWSWCVDDDHINLDKTIEVNIKPVEYHIKGTSITATNGIKSATINLSNGDTFDVEFGIDLVTAKLNDRQEYNKLIALKYPKKTVKRQILMYEDITLENFKSGDFSVEAKTKYERNSMFYFCMRYVTKTPVVRHLDTCAERGFFSAVSGTFAYKSSRPTLNVVSYTTFITKIREDYKKANPPKPRIRKFKNSTEAIKAFANGEYGIKVSTQEQKDFVVNHVGLRPTCRELVNPILAVLVDDGSLDGDVFGFKESDIIIKMLPVISFEKFEKLIKMNENDLVVGACWLGKRTRNHYKILGIVTNGTSANEGQKLVIFTLQDGNDWIAKEVSEFLENFELCTLP